MNIAQWLQPALDNRAEDTLRQISDQPTTVEQTRGDVVVGWLTVRLAARGLQALDQQSGSSETTLGRYAVVAPEGTDLRRGDRLAANGGIVYLVTYVAPDQIGRVEADAEVLQ